MTIGDKIYHLMHWCKGSVNIFINQHRDNHLTIVEHIREFGNGKELEEIGQQTLNGMIMLDQLVEIRFYPRNSTGSHLVRHYDLDCALDECIEITRNEDAIATMKKKARMDL